MKLAPRGGPELSELQRWLFGIVTDPRGLDVGTADAARIRRGGLDAGQRLAIYHRAYSARLVECLSDDYPALKYALGERSFELLCRDYVRDVPPAITLGGQKVFDTWSRTGTYATQPVPNQLNVNGVRAVIRIWDFRTKMTRQVTVDQDL